MPQAPVLGDATQSSDVGTLVRVHHRRRGWAFVAAGSAAGLAVYAGLDVDLIGSLTGIAATLRIIPVLVLLTLAVAGLAVVIVDTARIHRANQAVRASAKSSVSHYPVYAHAHRWPPRHLASWIAGVFMLVAMTCITGFYVPAQVNSWAYVLGAEHQDTFHPVSYTRNCSPGNGRMATSNCITVTEGYLSNSGAHVTWTSRVPLGQPFGVRDPFWAVGTGRNLISGNSSAIPDIVAGLFFDGVTVLLLYILVVIVQNTPPRRRQQAPVPAGADPDAVRPPHHPGRAHHADGTRSRARRGRGRH
jgi:hypothetical protein